MKQKILKKCNVPKDLIPGDLKRNREKLIRAQVPPHSKVPTKNWYRNFGRIKWDK
jgi:hypothetical protein